MPIVFKQFSDVPLDNIKYTFNFTTAIDFLNIFNETSFNKICIQGYK